MYQEQIENISAQPRYNTRTNAIFGECAREEALWNAVYSNALREVRGREKPNDVINIAYLEARANFVGMTGDGREEKRLRSWVLGMRVDRQAVIDRINGYYRLHKPFLSGRGI